MPNCSFTTQLAAQFTATGMSKVSGEAQSHNCTDEQVAHVPPGWHQHGDLKGHVLVQLLLLV